MSGTPEHWTWHAIRDRCYNESNHAYPSYGGRGITVCDRWLESFENFYADMGPRPSNDHSIDRYPDNDGPYAPDNCRWATRKEQCSNTRRNVFIEHNGVRLTMSDWALRLGVSRQVIDNRIKSGWSIEEILSPLHTVKHERRVKRCSVCGQNGHNRATCPQRKAA